MISAVKLPHVVLACTLLTVAVVSGCNSDQDDVVGGATPSPELSPDEVVKTQLEAIRDNGPNDSGLTIAFRFASPDSSISIGGRDYFAELFKSKQYQIMFDFTDVDYGEVLIEGYRARQIVTLKDDNSNCELFLFELVLSNSEPHRNCWLTSHVYHDSLDLRTHLAGVASDDA